NGMSAGPLPPLRAAPWERFCEPEHNDAVHHWQPEPSLLESATPIVDAPVEPQADDNEPAGCHTFGGVSVADLIAKVGGPAVRRPSHHHLAPDTTVEPEIPLALQDTQVIDTPAYSFDVVSEFADDADDPPVDDSGYDAAEAPLGKRKSRR